MFPVGFFGKKYFTGNYFAPITILVFVPRDGDQGGGGRVVATRKKVNAELIAQIQREDEELIAIVTAIGRMIL